MITLLLADLYEMWLNAKRKKLEKRHFFIDETGKIIVTKKEQTK